MKTMLRALYTNTVQPATICSVIVSVYSSGYSIGVDCTLDNKIAPFIPFLSNLVYSAAFGCLVGITYPVSVPALLAIDYYDSRKK
jgi:hypothetical protein